MCVHSFYSTTPQLGLFEHSRTIEILQDLFYLSPEVGIHVMMARPHRPPILLYLLRTYTVNYMFCQRYNVQIGVFDKVTGHDVTYAGSRTREDKIFLYKDSEHLISITSITGCLQARPSAQPV